MQAKRTIREVYGGASSFLQERGILSHQWEAEWLLRRLLGVDRARFFMIWHEEMKEENEWRLQTWLQRRGQGEPLQYILGDQVFYGRLFQVNSAVLIPRPETELLVERVIQEADIIWQDQPLDVVDVGTGSGVIAITLACEKPHWQVIAVDISAEALQVARTNARLHGVEKKIRWIHDSYLNSFQKEKRPVQILVSNPPYIPTAVVPTLEKQVARYEPHLALDGGVDGLEPYRILTRQCAAWPHAPRLLCFEVGTGQAEQVAQLIKQIASEVTVSVYPDLTGCDRVVVGRVTEE
jgi:release factor glutamine methyltransferase